MKRDVMDSEFRSQLAFRAADVLERDGWCQHTVSDDLGHHCLLGAFDVVLEETNHHYSLGFLDRLMEHLGVESWMGIGRWNDQPWRTQEQVVKELRAFAVKEAGCEDPG